MPRLPLLAALLAAAFACASPEYDRPPALPFDTVAVALVTGTDTVALQVELARTPDQRAYGLKDRASLDEDGGMLFVFDEIQDAGTGFWMWRTLVPLDAAFFDASGAVVAILSMEPCESPYAEWCPPYIPGVAYDRVLEVNQGWFGRHGVGPGSRLLLGGGG